MDGNNKILAVIAGFMFCIGCLCGYNEGESARLNDQRDTYKECLVAKETGNFEKCNKMQEKTSTEFLCNEAGKCWLEVK